MKAALLSVALLLTGCVSGRGKAAPKVMTGLDVLESQGFASLKGKRVGVITNRTGVDHDGRSIVGLLGDAPGVNLVAVYSSEHGFSASSEANAVPSGRVRAGSREVPLFSLFTGGVTKPSAAQLDGVDLLIFDIQDIGARYYTYLATMALALEAARDRGIEFMVLDRPNPIGGELVEGPILDETGLAGVDPVAFFPVSTRHGMTAGEMALFDNARIKHPKLTVVKMRGWKRSMWFDATGLPWVPPSPNMPDLTAAALYPGVANLEYSNVSVGRGTPVPFGWIGAPWMNADAMAKRLNEALLEGVEFSAQTYAPTKDIYEGQACPGVRIKITDRDAVRPLRVFAELAAALRDLHPDEYKLTWKSSRRLIGKKRFLELYERGAAGEEFARLFEADAAEFAKIRQPFLLYGN